MKNIFTLIFILTAYTALTGQHRGDNLSFQGINFENDFSVPALGMGNASVALSGSLSSVFTNPAGLADISKIQVSVSGSNLERNWRENQDYRPNRYFVTLPFYLEGLYVPLPENNNRWDHEVARDTSNPYAVDLPGLGLDPFSEEASDWNNELNGTTLLNAAVAFPFRVINKSFVVSAAFSRSSVWDYDRNQTYLDPHPGYDIYGDMGRVNGVDTLVIKWSDFMRSRKGYLNNVHYAAAVIINEYLKFGVGGVYSFGNTDDFQNLGRIGSFNLVRENRFRFYYQDMYSEVSGKSDFSSLKFNTGLILDLNRLRFGVNVNLPYTLKREWNYITQEIDSSGISERNISGTDEAEIPADFSIGLSIKPVEDLTVSFDLAKAAYSKTEFTLAIPDSFFNKWPDQTTIRLGAEYKASDLITLRAGYRNIPQLFVPDGAAVDDSGPVADSYTGGLGLNFFFGSFDFAFEYRRLKYYDSYHSNTNYVYENFFRVLAGFTYSF